MNTVIHLGLQGSLEPTFSERVYARMRACFPHLPHLSEHSTTVIKVSGNATLLSELGKNPGAYAIIPIETAVRGKIDEVIASFALLDTAVPISILSAHKVRVSFSLMVRENVRKDTITGVFGHPQALHACEYFLKKHGFTPVPMDNNAAGVHLIKTDRTYATHAALGPKSKDSGLTTIATECEDEPAYTTFLLAHHGINTHRVKHRVAKYRTLIAFNVPDYPGTLHAALRLFADWNLRYIQSVFESPLCGHRFVAEVECQEASMRNIQRLIERMRTDQTVLERCVFIGPYPVIESDG